MKRIYTKNFESLAIQNLTKKRRNWICLCKDFFSEENISEIETFVNNSA